MLAVVLFLILLWVVAGIVGFVVHGLFWLFIVACLLLLFTLVLGGFARGRRSTRQARLSRSSVRGADLLRTHRLGSPADNLAETAVKGSGLVVADELTVEDYNDRTGRTRTTTRITASHLGLSTRFASRPAAQPTREVITATP